MEICTGFLPCIRNIECKSACWLAWVPHNKKKLNFKHKKATFDHASICLCEKQAAKYSVLANFGEYPCLVGLHLDSFPVNFLWFHLSGLKWDVCQKLTPWIQRFLSHLIRTEDTFYSSLKCICKLFPVSLTLSVTKSSLMPLSHWVRPTPNWGMSCVLRSYFHQCVLSSDIVSIVRFN